jgi:hypothetical protein
MSANTLVKERKTMARFKDFGAGSAGKKTDPLVFKLYDQEFSCVPEVQGKMLLELISDSTSDDTSVQSAVTLKFLRTTLLDESLERFEALIGGKENIVTIDTLTDITAWLIEEYTTRPLEQPEDSLTGA